MGRVSKVRHRLTAWQCLELALLSGASGRGALGDARYLVSLPSILGQDRVILVATKLGMELAVSTWSYTMYVWAVRLVGIGACKMIEIAACNMHFQTMLNVDLRSRQAMLYYSKRIQSH